MTLLIGGEIPGSCGGGNQGGKTAGTVGEGVSGGIHIAG